MPCNSEYRHRITEDSTPVWDYDFKYRIYSATNSFIEEKLGTTSVIDKTFVKSIVDKTCVYTQDPDADFVDPTIGCKDCVTASKQTFNMVRSTTEHFYAPVEPVDFRANARTSTNYALFTDLVRVSPNGINFITSYEQLPPIAPSAMELSDALRAITPNIETFFPSLNLYETLFELKELRKLLDLFKVRVKQAPKDTFVGHYLGFNFGYVPLVSTITDVLDILLTLDNVIDKWNDFATSDRIMDFHGTLRKMEWTGSAVENIDESASTYTAQRWVDYKYTVKDSHRVHLYIKPHIIPGNMRFRVLLKALGIDKPLAGFWELVPFSWLVDYFVNVDDMIARWETGLTSMFKFSVVNLGYSTHRDMLVESQETSVWNGGATTVTPWATATDVRFERTPLAVTSLRDAIIPTEWGWAGGPSGVQWTYIAAIESNMLRK